MLIDFKFEDLTVFIKAPTIEYKLQTSNLKLKMSQTAKILDVNVGLHNFTL